MTLLVIPRRHPRHVLRATHSRKKVDTVKRLDGRLVPLTFIAWAPAATEVSEFSARLQSLGQPSSPSKDDVDERGFEYVRPMACSAIRGGSGGYRL